MTHPKNWAILALSLLLIAPAALSANGPPPHANDPFVDEDGDTMTGDLVFTEGAGIDLGDGSLTLNGGELTSPDGQALVFAGQNVCFEEEDLLECEGFDWHFTGNAGTDPNTHFLGTTDGQPLRISAAGVGIGTASPGAALHVAGDQLVDDTLGVGGQTSILGGLDVAGATILGSTLDVATDTTVGGALDVGGAGSFGGALDVAGTEVRLNNLGPDGNSRVCFFDAGGACNEYLMWDDADDEGAGNFTISDDLVVQGSVAETSTLMLKEDVQPMLGALAKALALEGVTYTWRESGERDLGLIAEEVALVVPEAVVYDDAGQPVAVKYGHLVGLLLEAIEEQQAQYDLLDERISALEDVLGGPLP